MFPDVDPATLRHADRPESGTVERPVADFPERPRERDMLEARLKEARAPDSCQTLVQHNSPEPSTVAERTATDLSQRLWCDEALEPGLPKRLLANLLERARKLHAPKTATPAEGLRANRPQLAAVREHDTRKLPTHPKGLLSDLPNARGDRHLLNATAAEPEAPDARNSLRKCHVRERPQVPEEPAPERHVLCGQNFHRVLNHAPDVHCAAAGDPDRSETSAVVERVLLKLHQRAWQRNLRNSAVLEGPAVRMRFFLLVLSDRRLARSQTLQPFVQPNQRQVRAVPERAVSDLPQAGGG